MNVPTLAAYAASPTPPDDAALACRGVRTSCIITVGLAVALFPWQLQLVKCAKTDSAGLTNDTYLVRYSCPRAH